MSLTGKTCPRLVQCAAQCSVQPTQQPLTADSSFPGVSEASSPHSLSSLLEAPWSQHKHLPPLPTSAEAALTLQVAQLWLARKSCRAAGGARRQAQAEK